jgi:hypothetical protein
VVNEQIWALASEGSSEESLSRGEPGARMNGALEVDEQETVRINQFNGPV